MCYQIKLLAILIRCCRNCIHKFTALVRYPPHWMLYTQVKYGKEWQIVTNFTINLYTASVNWVRTAGGFTRLPAQHMQMRTWSDPSSMAGRGLRGVHQNPPHTYCISTAWIWEICHTPFGQSVCLLFIIIFNIQRPKENNPQWKNCFTMDILYTVSLIFILLY